MPQHTQAHSHGKNHIPFMPTIIEHAASLINQTPSAAAKNARLMAMAHAKAYRQYQLSAVTVGIDVYNIEAEALGAQVRFYDDNSIPGIVARPFSLDTQMGDLAFSIDRGRIRLILEAASMVRDEISEETNVNIGICGPFSIMVELLGYEAAMEAIYDEDVRIHTLLETLLEFQMCYTAHIASGGIGAVVFESWASPPLISPAIYRKYALPYEKALLSHMKQLGFNRCPLVIGGDTNNIIDVMLETGTSLLVSDYNTNLRQYVDKVSQKDVTVRANIDPKLVQQGAWKEIGKRIREIKSIEYTRIVAGTGVIPYDTPPENILQLKKMLEN